MRDRTVRAGRGSTGHMIRPDQMVDPTQCCGKARKKSEMRAFGPGSTWVGGANRKDSFVKWELAEQEKKKTPATLSQ